MNNSTIRKGWNLAIGKLKGILLGEISHERQILYHLIYMWNLETKQNTLKKKQKLNKTTTATRNKLTDTMNRLAFARGRRWRVEEVGKEGQKVQTTSYKISYGAVSYNLVTTVNNVLHV